MIYASFPRQFVLVPIFAEPLDEIPESFGERSLGLIAKLGGGAGDVGAGDFDVAGLHGLAVEDGGQADGGFQGANHFSQRDRAVVAKVKDAVAVAAFDGGEQAGADVVNIGVIAGGGAVA